MAPRFVSHVDWQADAAPFISYDQQLSAKIQVKNPPAKAKRFISHDDWCSGSIRFVSYDATVSAHVINGQRSTPLHSATHKSDESPLDGVMGQLYDAFLGSGVEADPCTPATPLLRARALASALRLAAAMSDDVDERVSMFAFVRLLERMGSSFSSSFTRAEWLAFKPPPGEHLLPAQEAGLTACLTPT